MKLYSRAKIHSLNLKGSNYKGGIGLFGTSKTKLVSIALILSISLVGEGDRISPTPNKKEVPLMLYLNVASF